MVLTTTENDTRRLPSTAWKPGESGNPAGRPPGTKNKLVTIKRKLEIAVREGMSADRLGRILNKVAGMAEQGDLKAARLIFDAFISKAEAGDDEVDKQSGGITIRIENATFAKTHPTLDAQFTEIK